MFPFYACLLLSSVHAHFIESVVYDILILFSGVWGEACGWGGGGMLLLEKVPMLAQRDEI